jgi:lysophospholipase L1-like esterase
MLALVLVFVAAESAARAWLRRYGRYYVWTPYARTRMSIDADVLPKLDPVARFEINADGERGDPVPHDDSKLYRILVAGGSATECYYLDQAASWPQVLARTLNTPASLSSLVADRAIDRVHVGNVSRSLAASKHLCRIMRAVLPRYRRLDAIVLLVGGSDVIRWLERRAPAVIDDDPVPVSDVFAQHPEGPFGWSAHTLALRRIVKYWYVRLGRPVERRERVGKRLARCRAMRSRAKTILRTVPSPEPMLEHFERNLRALIALSRRHSDRVIVVHQPWFDKQFTPDEARLMWSFAAGPLQDSEATDYYAHDLVWDLLRQVNARTAKVVRELGAEQLDLMPVLERNLEIYYDELHHTPAGCRVIGDHVARAILRTPVAAPRRQRTAAHRANAAASSREPVGVAHVDPALHAHEDAPAIATETARSTEAKRPRSRLALSLRHLAASARWREWKRVFSAAHL